MIGILIGIVFIFLVFKAIFETIWGTLCIIWGLFLHLVALVLDVIGYATRGYRKLRHLANW